MKKGTFLIKISILVLTLCLFVYGVYAAKNAQLTATGQVGFELHNASVGVQLTGISGAINNSGVTMTLSNLKSVSGVGSELKITSTGTSASTGSISIYNNTTTSTNADRALYFDSSQATIPPIILTFSVKNYSEFKIKITNTTLTGTLNSSKIRWTLTLSSSNSSGISAGGTDSFSIKLEYVSSATDTFAASYSITTVVFKKA